MLLEDDDSERLLVRELARRILEADWSRPTRADNLNRGLSGQEYTFVRRLINGFIKCRLLLPKSTLTGLVIQKGTHSEWTATLEGIIDGVEFPSEIASVMK